MNPQDLERFGQSLTVCEEKIRSLRRNVQSYVGSNINGRDSVFMLNIDTELGLAMSIMNQLGKKRQIGLDQVSEVITSRSQRSRRPTGEPEKSEAVKEIKVNISFFSTVKGA